MRRMATTIPVNFQLGRTALKQTFLTILVEDSAHRENLLKIQWGRLFFFKAGLDITKHSFLEITVKSFRPIKCIYKNLKMEIYSLS